MSCEVVKWEERGKGLLKNRGGLINFPPRKRAGVIREGGRLVEDLRKI